MPKTRPFWILRISVFLCFWVEFAPFMLKASTFTRCEPQPSQTTPKLWFKGVIRFNSWKKLMHSTWWPTAAPPCFQPRTGVWPGHSTAGRPSKDDRRRWLWNKITWENYFLTFLGGNRSITIETGNFLYLPLPTSIAIQSTGISVRRTESLVIRNETPHQNVPSHGFDIHTPR